MTEVGGGLVGDFAGTDDDLRASIAFSVTLVTAAAAAAVGVLVGDL